MKSPKIQDPSPTRRYRLHLSLSSDRTATKISITHQLPVRLGATNAYSLALSKNRKRSSVRLCSYGGLQGHELYRIQIDARLFFVFFFPLSVNYLSRPHYIQRNVGHPRGFLSDINTLHPDSSCQREEPGAPQARRWSRRHEIASW